MATSSVSVVVDFKYPRWWRLAFAVGYALVRFGADQKRVGRLLGRLIVWGGRFEVSLA